MNSISKTSDRHLFFINFKAGDRDLFENTSIIEDTKDRKINIIKSYIADYHLLYATNNIDIKDRRMMHIENIVRETIKEKVRSILYNISIIGSTITKCLNYKQNHEFRHSFRHSDSVNNSNADSNKCLNDVSENAVRHFSNKERTKIWFMSCLANNRAMEMYTGKKLFNSNKR